MTQVAQAAQSTAEGIEHPGRCLGSISDGFQSAKIGRRVQGGLSREIWLVAGA